MQSRFSAPVALSSRRHLTEQQWRRFLAPEVVADATPAARLPETGVSRDIVASWRRSARYLGGTVPRAPAEDRHLARALWEASPLSRAADGQRSELERMAREGGLLAAISDPRGRLLWTYASEHMRKRAEAVNFIDGGRWDERAVGTNAVGLGLRLRRPVTVFSSEHFQPFVHDWVCYAAPILHPRTGACLGLLDLSTTWDRHTPLGQAAATELARSIALALSEAPARAELEIRALGPAAVCFRGQPLGLSQRQIEILCLLALNPDGLDLEALHAALYGDAAVSKSTLKAELSQLRALLLGQIGSRPYRLLLSVQADFIDIWQALRARRAGDAAGLYRGPLLPRSSSPELEEWRHCIDAVMAQMLDSCDEPRALLDRLCHSTTGSELVRDRLAQLMEMPPRR